MVFLAINKLCLRRAPAQPIFARLPQRLAARRRRGTHRTEITRIPGIPHEDNIPHRFGPDALLVPTLAQRVAAQAVPSEPLDRIVAVVNEDVVLQSELDGRVAAVTRQYAATRSSCRRTTCSNARCWTA